MYFSFVGQHLPDDWEEQFHSFRLFIENHKSNVSLENIGNIDEVPVSFDMPSKYTVDEKGSKEVRIASTGHEKSNFTLVLGITADGSKLPPMVIFKRKTIPNEDFPKGTSVVNFTHHLHDPQFQRFWFEQMKKVG